MAKTCRAEWCSALPVHGSRYCVIHEKQPPLHNLETYNQWLTRTNRAKAAAKKAAAKAAKSDAALAAKRGTGAAR